MAKSNNFTFAENAGLKRQFCASEAPLAIVALVNESQWKDICENTLSARTRKTAAQDDSTGGAKIAEASKRGKG